MIAVGKLGLILKDTAYRAALFKHRVAAAVEHSAVLRQIDCRTVIDIGANRGQFALVARNCCPSARILSFEPLPVPAESFRRVFGSERRILLHQAAIGRTSGEALIHVSRKDDSSSLLPISPLQTRVFPGTAEVGTRNVRIGPLSEFVSAEDIEHPAILKLDVQGYELEALHGCEDLFNYFSYIYAECSFLELYEQQVLADKVIVWLHDRAFRLCGAYNVVYDSQGVSIQADFLFKSASEAEI